MLNTDPAYRGITRCSTRVWGLTAFICLLPVCHKADAPPSPAKLHSSSEAQPSDVASGTPDSGSRAFDGDFQVADPDRWLFVDKVRGKARGAWATGSFDEKRNKLIVQTKEVAAFTLDVSRIPIDWDRLVIVSINGNNSELRKRKHPRLRFELDRHRRWVVAEP